MAAGRLIINMVRYKSNLDEWRDWVYLQVKVAGVEYQPAVASANKKQAKADAALLALQKLGIMC